jgi:hypothetical protein
MLLMEWKSDYAQAGQKTNQSDPAYFCGHFGSCVFGVFAVPVALGRLGNAA